jgi:hypothetical protein
MELCFFLGLASVFARELTNRLGVFAENHPRNHSYPDYVQLVYHNMRRSWGT